MAFSRRMTLALATGGFIGHLPKAPGTFGSIVALPICIGLTFFPMIIATILVGLITIVAITVAGAAEKELGTKDPGCIVIDEVAGQLVTLLGVPLSLPGVVGGFILFRCLDIAKPFPIRWIDSHLSGGIGIVADDIVAGLLANVIIRLMMVIL